MKGNPLTIRVLEAGEYIAADWLQWGTAVCRLNEWVEERLVESMEIMTRHVYRLSDNQWGSTVLNHLLYHPLPTPIYLTVFLNLTGAALQMHSGLVVAEGPS